MAQQSNGTIVTSGFRISRLTRAQCQKLHEATLTVLERTGVRLYEPAAVEIMRKAGASVCEDNRVRIPERLVERALASAPKKLVMYDRNGQPAMRVEGYRSYFGPGSDLLNIVDHRTGQRRKPVLQDVVEAITVVDALENIDFAMSFFLPRDVNQQIADRYQMEIMLSRTTKPIVFVTYDTLGCIDAVEMAEAVAGSPDALREKPFVCCYINVTTGLRHNQEAVQKLLYLSEKGLPFMYIPVVSGGLTAPMPVAGAYVHTNAGVLAGVVLSQLVRPGTPIIVPGWGGGSIDMRTLVEPYCSPDFQGVAQSMARFYELPTFTMGGCSEAKLPDQQAAGEAALTLLTLVLAGGHICHDLGYLESGLSGSLAQLAICDELVHWIKRAVADVEISDETLAVDLIDEVGPDGQYLECEHTQRHYRERWYPRLFERDTYDRWATKGGTTLLERAVERVNHILATHQPQPLPEATARAVHAIVERAEAKYVHK